MQIKNHICLFLAFFLLVSNSGLAINVHFCEGKIAGFSSIFANEEVCVEPINEDKACCSKPDPQHKKCCSDKEVNLKNKTEKIVLKTISFNFDSAHLVNYWKPNGFNSIPKVANNYNVVYYCDANAPPLYELYSQYIFYA